MCRATKATSRREQRFSSPPQRSRRTERFRPLESITSRTGSGRQCDREHRGRSSVIVRLRSDVFGLPRLASGRPTFLTMRDVRVWHSSSATYHAAIKKRPTFATGKLFFNCLLFATGPFFLFLDPFRLRCVPLLLGPFRNIFDFRR